MHPPKNKTSSPQRGIAGLFSLLGCFAFFGNVVAADPLPPAKGTTDETPMAKGGSGNGHYNMDSRVYMDVGLAMGEAMVKLLNDGKN
jgi:hypothetical protein